MELNLKQIEKKYLQKYLKTEQLISSFVWFGFGFVLHFAWGKVLLFSLELTV